MDFGKRIASLTEWEAKECLVNMIDKAEKSLDCGTCPAGYKSPSAEECKNKILTELLEGL